jgi:hypothetical protein
VRDEVELLVKKGLQARGVGVPVGANSGGEILREQKR